MPICAHKGWEQQVVLSKLPILTSSIVITKSSGQPISINCAGSVPLVHSVNSWLIYRR